MDFMNSTVLDELARRLAESVPPSVRAFAKDLESNFKAVLQAQLAKSPSKPHCFRGHRLHGSHLRGSSSTTAPRIT